MLSCLCHLVMLICIIHIVVLTCLDGVIIIFISLSMLAIYIMNLYLLTHRLNLHHIIHHKLTCRWVTAITELIWELRLILVNRYILHHIQLEWRLHRIWFHHHLLRLAHFIQLHLFIAELKKVQQKKHASNTNRSDIDKGSNTELTIEVLPVEYRWKFKAINLKMEEAFMTLYDVTSQGLVLWDT
jgi:hypothetical protein